MMTPSLELAVIGVFDLLRVSTVTSINSFVSDGFIPEGKILSLCFYLLLS